MTVAPDGGFGLYIHWPFCQSKCPYCDFNSHVAATIDQRRWQAAYLTEIDRLGRELPHRVLQTVFFGGGTPSLMDPDLVAAILEKVRSTWPMSNDPEITLEANPGSVDSARFAAYRAGGVNRVSIGVQALNDIDLRRLGRTHSTTEAIRAIEIARATFPRFNFDLIYARQGQDMASWRQELSTALLLKPSHLSLYQLTVEEGTVFHERNLRGLLAGLPNESLSADLYLLTQEICGNAGLPAYEVSNHAALGEESRHNLIYWRGGEYMGIGPGAHGRLSGAGARYTTECPKEPLYWLKSVEQTGSGELPRTELEPEEQAAEFLMMGLRLHEGVSIERFQSIAGKQVDPEKLDHLQNHDLIRVDQNRMFATLSGMLVLNGILRDLLTD